MEAFTVCYTGGIQLEREINSNLVEDNKETARSLKKESFPSKIIEDIKVPHS